MMNLKLLFALLAVVWLLYAVINLASFGLGLCHHYDGPAGASPALDCSTLWVALTRFGLFGLLLVLHVVRKD